MVPLFYVFIQKKVPNTAQSPDIIQCIINKSKHHERFIMKYINSVRSI
ncbi:MAG TPA: hypothetical protein H9891_02540 [Candidatus Salinicoccus stercoripullorum]|uniref:Uncharacterized protein n=1 Tax=Candidatus Salinicoccus stercoripullorum TaxID=2838756 RepID=A0A9D1TYX3_9STAP|nr:hypothetical protein [Candidatus Salinicoccus stercoripullorum]